MKKNSLKMVFKTVKNVKRICSFISQVRVPTFPFNRKFPCISREKVFSISNLSTIKRNVGDAAVCSMQSPLFIISKGTWIKLVKSTVWIWRAFCIRQFLLQSDVLSTNQRSSLQQEQSKACSESLDKQRNRKFYYHG